LVSNSLENGIPTRMPRSTFQTPHGQLTEVLLRRQDLNGKITDTTTEQQEDLIAMVCLRIWIRLIMSQLLSSTPALITQLAATPPRSNGTKSLSLSRERITLSVSIMLIKDLLVETWLKMLILFNSSLSTLTDSASSNHLPKTLVYMVRELDAFLSLLQDPPSPRWSAPDLRVLPDQCTPTHQFTELESLTSS